MKNDELKTLLKDSLSAALATFFKAEIKNILANVSERNLCGRLGSHLEFEIAKNELKDYHVDIEYNRNLGKVKTVFDSDLLEVIQITCDLLIHSRGEIIEQDNLLALEMKKESHPNWAKDADRKRLRLLTRKSFDGVWSFDGKTLPEHVCLYVLGVFMEIDVKNRICLMEYYESGEMTSEDNLTF